MGLEREIIIKEISDLLALLQLEIKNRNSLKLYDINLVAEEFLCAFLNLVYGWNLTNANRIHHDEPGIDLIDKQNHIVFQITTTRTSKKIQHSIDEFVANNSDSEAYELFVLVITGRQTTYSSDFAVSNNLIFDKKENIWDLRNVLAEIKRKPLSQQQHILDFLKREMGKKDSKETESDAEILYAKKINDFLRYRRVIRPSIEKHQGGHTLYSFQYCLKSVLEIKEKLIELRQEMIEKHVGDESYIFVVSGQMVDTCNDFLTKYERRFQGREIITAPASSTTIAKLNSPLGLLERFQDNFEKLKIGIIDTYKLKD